MSHLALRGARRFTADLWLLHLEDAEVRARRLDVRFSTGARHRIYLSHFSLIDLLFGGCLDRCYILQIVINSPLLAKTFVNDGLWLEVLARRLLTTARLGGGLPGARTWTPLFASPNDVGELCEGVVWRFVRHLLSKVPIQTVQSRM